MPKVTITCGYCRTEFTVPYGERKRRFCSKSCGLRGSPRKKKRVRRSVCIICDVEFEHYGEQMCCGRACHAKYMSLARVGENNPAWKDKNVEVCQQCGEEFSYNRVGLHIGRVRRYCSKVCWDVYQKGKNRTLDGPAIYPTPYPITFSRRLKRRIRLRDGYQCVLCGSQKNGKSLPIHHIDYDKENCDESNLVTLCMRCHGMTNHYRFFWQTLFMTLAANSKLVRKGWGYEIHLTNGPLYCLKFLVFFAEKRFSHHYHVLKREFWFCLVGDMELVVEHVPGKPTTSRFISGATIEIEPGVAHQLIAKKNSIIVEVSTRDFPEDSIRLIKGD